MRLRLGRYWVTWERQRRNLELSKALSCQYHEFNFDDRNKLLRYLLCLYQTVMLIRREKPRLIFGQNPSILLAILLVVLKPFYGYCLVIDAHNAAIYPFEGAYPRINQAMKKMHVLADLVLVTNENIQTELESVGGQAFVLPDKIPTVDSASRKVLEGKVNVLLICRFHNDEPYWEAFEAMRGLPEDVILYVSGNHSRLSAEVIADLPQNVRLMGFVPEREFEAVLNSVDAVMDLTTRENCLLCGAYEAVGAEKPMVLSRKAALQQYFHKGVVFVENTPQEIREGLKELIKNRAVLTREVILLKDEMEVSWHRRLHELEDQIERLKSGSQSTRGNNCYRTSKNSLL